MPAAGLPGLLQIGTTCSVPIDEGRLG